MELKPEEMMNEKYLKAEKIASEEKKQYEEIYKRVLNKHLNASLIEPLAKIVLERDNTELKCESAIESLNATLLEQLLTTWNDNFWEPLVAQKLIILKILTENKDVKTSDGNSKRPAERIAPLRMHYKEKRVEFLKTQIEHQTKIIAEKSKIAVNRRNFMHQVRDECLQLNECIRNISEKNAEEEQILEEFINLCKDEEDNIFTAKPKVRQEF